MQLQKPQLFTETKSFLWVLLCIVSVVVLRLIMSYQEYQSFIAKPFYYTYADVISEKVKTTANGKSYNVLKLHSDSGMHFITTSYTQNTYAKKHLRLQIFPDEKITFRGYLSTFFVKSHIKEVLPMQSTYKDSLLQQVAQQHQSKMLASFYNAIFFAAPLSDDLRERISKLGVSHLIALSGFHLGILWGIIYGLIKVIYTIFQQRYFPYRYVLIDVGAVTFIALAIYLWFVDFPPSLVRSYAMLLVGWIMLLLGIELLSFTFLFAVVGMLLALFPSLVVSLAFWLSVAGVFAIFLLLKYTKNINKHLIAVLVIPLGIFVLMLPVVHSTFPMTTLYQLLSPVLSLLFILFYPLVIVLHLIGYGGIFDEVLTWLFDVGSDIKYHLLPVEMMFVYIILAFLSIIYKRAFVLLIFTAFSYALYIFLL
ncbi:ComEC/Rec2 family competence protein [Sulfurovum sp. zt1-1]|uniref:ComEC/Rec2 family competence protein n=1 Tax=Sulfurovum zhangzhouensis TaxID=3019067 RepID=A0ABT7QXZ9_9BACT|nr:ComEC/Rec2 family competence protein [Sulfurovum zhangzhouensis]MDM5271419.1 ComEC/Rec2 family competence protein [Sulfurovum zhangzhouensis]